MKDSDARARRASHVDGPAIQVICLGSGGGPSEDNVTGLLVRSTASKWSKGSLLAVDAGSHLAAITRILQQHFPYVSDGSPATKRMANKEEDLLTPLNDSHANDADHSETGSASEREETPTNPTTTLASGAFAGLPFPYRSARANAVHVMREHLTTYLITHPHLDHLSGFIINTAALQNTNKPKTIAGLPSTVHAIKAHIFNDIIWPNLTDQDGGAGLVRFTQLAEGGNIAVGEGPGSGFIEVCEGLGVKGFKVSHGHCRRGCIHVQRGSLGDIAEPNPSLSHTQVPRPHHHHMPAIGGNSVQDRRSSIISYPASQPGTPLLQASAEPQGPPQCVSDSTAYFIRAEASSHTPAREILVFGDVEPDSISYYPRTYLVWREAAPKIAQGVLTGIFIECSYNDSQADKVLFGHLAPRHLIAELETLAQMVREERLKLDREREDARKGRKRKRASNGFAGPSSTSAFATDAKDENGIGAANSNSAPPHPPPAALRTPRRFSSRPNLADASSTNSNNGDVVDDALLPPADYALTPPVSASSHPYTPAGAPPLLDLSLTPSSTARWDEGPLKGLKVVVIHVKDTHADGRLLGESILEQLQERERGLRAEGRGLGCEFVISGGGGSYFF